MTTPTPPYRRIAWMTDGSTRADACRPWVVLLAGLGAEGVHVVYAGGAPLGASNPFPHTGQYDEPVLLAEARQRTEERAAGLLLDSVPARVWVDHGQPWELARQMVDEQGVDLVVCGKSGASGLDRLLLGSTAARMVRELPCDVLVVPPDAPAALRRILAPVAPDHEATRAIDRTLALAGVEPGGAFFLHALTDRAPDAHAQSRAALEARLQPHLLPLDPPPRHRALAVSASRPADAILRVAGDYDLVVMGTHGRTGLPRLVLGSVAEAVLKDSPTPTLITRSPAG